jgi:hypothetical protein
MSTTHRTDCTRRTLRTFLVLFVATTGASVVAQGPAEQPSGPAIDISGYWTPTMNEDGMERGPGSELHDYGGFPLNEAGRLWALSYDPSRVTLRHHQCDAYVTPYQMRATGNFRAWEERDPHTQRLVAIHWWAQVTEGHRVIWMDGRPHPPAWAPHTFRGFSTGKYVGNALVVTTTHLKQGWLRRNGTPESDQATVTEFFVRHGDHLTNTTVVSDPVFLTEPMVRSNDYYRTPVDHGTWLYACDDSEQIVGRAPDVVPHYDFGKQPYAREYSERHKLPLGVAWTGAPSMYPGYGDTAAKNMTDAQGLALLSPAPGRPNETSKAVDPEPRDGEIHVLPIRENVYMLVGDGGNIVVQTGDQGAFVVDSGTGRLSDKVIAAIDKLMRTSDPVHREHELSGGPYGRQRETGSRGHGSEPPGFLLCQFGAPSGDGSVRRSASTRHDHRAQQRDDQDAGRENWRGCRARRYLSRRTPPQVTQRRQHRDVLRAQCRHRRRQHRLLPPR